MDIDNTINGVWKLNVNTGENEQLIFDSRNTASWWLDSNFNLALAMTWPDMDLERNGRFIDERWRESSERRLVLVSDNSFKDELPIELDIYRDDLLVQFDDPVFSKTGEKPYYLSQEQTDTVSIMDMKIALCELTNHSTW